MKPAELLKCEKSLLSEALRPLFCLASPQLLPPFKTPRTPEEWAEVDSEFAQSLVPAAISAASPEEKNLILCQGIHEVMTTKFGAQPPRKPRNNRRRHHERNLRKLTKEKNAARKDLRKARREAQDEEAVRDLSIKFHKLLRN